MNMKGSEELLQHNLEHGLPLVGDKRDIKAYQEVFRRLKQQPAQALSNNFEDRIIVKVLERKAKESRRDLVWFGIGVFCLIIAGIIPLVLSDFRPELDSLKKLSGLGGLVLFSFLFLFILNQIEKKFLLRRFTSER